MRAVLYWVVGIAILSGIIWYSLMDNARLCEELRLSVETASAAANYCQEADECRAVAFGCPFGCETLMHRDEFLELRQKVSEYTSNCMYICPDNCPTPSTPLVCEQGRCKRA